MLDGRFRWAPSDRASLLLRGGLLGQLKSFAISTSASHVTSIEDWGRRSVDFFEQELYHRHPDSLAEPDAERLVGPTGQQNVCNCRSETVSGAGGATPGPRGAQIPERRNSQGALGPGRSPDPVGNAPHVSARLYDICPAVGSLRPATGSIRPAVDSSGHLYPDV
jgi:hypothetical protein